MLFQRKKPATYEPKAKKNDDLSGKTERKPSWRRGAFQTWQGARRIIVAAAAPLLVLRLLLLLRSCPLWTELGIRWSQSSKLAGKSADALHLRGGAVEKQGLPDYRYTDIWGDGPPPLAMRAAGWWSWKARQHRQHVRVLKSQIPFPASLATQREYLGCPVLVNHKHRLAYIKLQKTGSTAIVHRFTECGKAGADPDTCFEWVSGLSEAEVERLWGSYFVFSSVRSPYARAVSSYTFLTVLSSMNSSCAAHGYTWDVFCRDPASIGVYCPANHRCCKGWQKSFPPQWYLRHVLQQSRCLTTVSGGWAVDYLLRQENLSADLKSMVDYVNRQRAATGDQGNGGPPALPTRLAEELPVVRVTNRSGAAANSLAEHFAPPYAQCKGHTLRFFADDFNLLVIAGS